MIHGNQAYNVCQDWVLSTVSIIQGSLGAPRTSSHDHTGVAPSRLVLKSVSVAELVIVSAVSPRAYDSQTMGTYVLSRITIPPSCLR